MRVWKWVAAIAAAISAVVVYRWLTRQREETPSEFETREPTRAEAA